MRSFFPFIPFGDDLRLSKVRLNEVEECEFDRISLMSRSPLPHSQGRPIAVGGSLGASGTAAGISPSISSSSIIKANDSKGGNVLSGAPLHHTP